MNYSDLPILEAIAEELTPLLPDYVIGCERQMLIIQHPALWVDPHNARTMQETLRAIRAGLAGGLRGRDTAVMVDILISAPVVMHYNTDLGTIWTLGQTFEVAHPRCIDDIIILVNQKLNPVSN